MIDIARHFIQEETILEVEPFGSGHIHQTFLIKTSGSRLVLQQFNYRVFKNPGAVMDNIIRITQHLSSSLSAGYVTLHFVKSIDGHYFFKDKDQGLWRAYHFIENSKTYSQAIKPEIPLQAGKAYGEFILKSLELDPGKFYTTILDFHNMESRWEQFKKAKDINYQGRIETAEREIKYFLENIKRVLDFERSNSDLPLRIVHNDPKIDNVLFDDQDRGICVIDLDTVMPGFIFNDFGDAIRTLSNTAVEDEQDFSQVKFDKLLFANYCNGFLSKLKNHLTADEVASLEFAPYFMTFIIGLRFLTDYLAGDHYYKIKYPDHNLIRARVQIAYLKELDQNSNYIRDFIRTFKH